MIARIKDFIRTAGGESIITLVTPADCAEEIDELKDAEIDVTLKKHRKRRSLDANAYAWVLMDKIAAALKSSPEAVYRYEIRQIAGVSDVVCAREEAVASFCEGWRAKGLGWLTETFPSKIDGCVNIRVYFGSSTYDSAQMKRLIDAIIQDAKSLGITTETPDEIAKMISLWGNEK